LLLKDIAGIKIEIFARHSWFNPFFEEHYKKLNEKLLNWRNPFILEVHALKFVTN